MTTLETVRIIALEEHLLPAGPTPEWLRARGVADDLTEVGERRLAVMDDAGVDVQVLSVLGHDIQQLAPADAAAAAREANDRTAAAVAAHPDRFAAFATLPMSDPTAAALELARTRHEHGFVGAMVHGQTHGVFLDDPSVDPVHDAAAALGVPIYLHPAPPPAAVHEAYYTGLGEVVGAVLATGAWGWHAECGMHVLRMVASGVFDRHPGLRLVVGHMGENLPFSLDRAADRLDPLVNLPRGVRQTVLDHVLITTSGYHFDAPLRCALEVFGPERVLFSVDFPFAASAPAVEYLRTAPVGDDVRHALAHGNAERLLGIQPGGGPYG